VASIVVCDPRQQVRDRISTLMSTVPGMDPVVPVSAVAELLDRYAARADVVLMGAQPDPSVVPNAIRDLLARDPGAVVLVFGDGDEHAQVTSAMSAGARGFLCADASQIEVSAALAHALPMNVLRRGPGANGDSAATRPAPASGQSRGQSGAHSGDSPSPMSPNGAKMRSTLTERELQVLRGISEGKTNVQIGRVLFLSEDTVKTHARRLFRKLGVHHRAEAVARALRDGLIR